MGKSFRVFNLFLVVAILLAASAYDRDFYKKEYAHLNKQIPANHVEKLYKYKKEKVKIMASNLPTLLTLSVQVVWDNLSSPDKPKKQGVAWAASSSKDADKAEVVEEVYREARGKELKENLKESYLALNDYLHLVVMDAQLKANPDSLITQQEAIEMYQKTDLFTITPTQQEEITKNKAQRGKTARKNYQEAAVKLAELNSPDPKAGLKASVAKVAAVQSKVMDALEEVNGYLEMTALQIQTMVSEQPAYAAEAQQVAEETGQNQNKQEEFKISPDDPLINGSRYRPAAGGYRVTGKASGRRMDRVMQWSEFILRAANKYNVDPALVAAIIEQESGGNENAISRTGAIGLMQLMPGTARGLGVNPYDPVQNIEGGTKYIAIQLNRFGGDETLALAAYNAGPGNAHRWYRIRETSHYVQNVPVIKSKYLNAFNR